MLISLVVIVCASLRILEFGGSEALGRKELFRSRRSSELKWTRFGDAKHFFVWEARLVCCWRCAVPVASYYRLLPPQPSPPIVFYEADSSAKRLVREGVFMCCS